MKNEPDWGWRAWVREAVAGYVGDLVASALAKVHSRLDSQRIRMDMLEKRLDEEREAHLKTRAALCVLAARVEVVEDVQGEVVYPSVEAGG